MLAGQQDEAHQGAEGVDKGDGLGRQTAARAADGLGPGPPLARLAFWWTGTMVPSTRAYSKSGSSDRHAKTRSTTPPFTQRRKRWKTLFQLPKSLGRSRQGTPVRTRHSTASRNSRLSLAVAPGSEALPGSSGAIFSQTASPTMNRDLSSIAPTPPKRRLKHDPHARESSMSTGPSPPAALSGQAPAESVGRPRTCDWPARRRGRASLSSARRVPDQGEGL